MTAPGQIIPAQPGWWPRTARTGISQCGYGWDVSTQGVLFPVGHAQCGYGWDTSAMGGAPQYSAVGAGYAGNGGGSFNHTAAEGDTVLCFVVVDRGGGAENYTVTYGGASMLLLDKQLMDSGASGTGDLRVFIKRNVAAGTASVVCNSTGAWMAMNTVSYSMANSFKIPKAVKGQSSSPSQSLTSDSDRIVQSFGVYANQIASPTGGTNRVNNLHSSDYIALQISDDNEDETFGCTVSNDYYAGMGIALSTKELLCPKAVGPANTIGTGSPQTFTSTDAAGDLVLLFVAADRVSYLSATYDGVAMLYLGQAFCQGESGPGGIHVFCLLSAPGGAKTVSITNPGAATLSANTVSIERAVAISAAPQTFNDSTTDMSHSVTCAEGDLVAHAYGQAGNNTITALSGAARLWNRNGTSAMALNMTDEDTTVHGTGTQNRWGSIAVPVTDEAPSGVVLLDKVGPGNDITTNTSLSWSHDATSGATVYVDVVCDRSNGGEDVTSITHDGNAMTLVDSHTFSYPSYGNSKIWRYKKTNVAGGSKTISVSFSGPGGTSWHSGHSVSFLNVDSEGTTQKADGSSTTPSVAATCSAGEAILANIAMRAGLTRPRGGVGLRALHSGNLSGVMSYADVSTTFSDVSSVSWGAIATPLLPA